MRADQPLADTGVTLLGAGPVEADMLARARRLAPTLVAADGGADHVREQGLPVAQIIGDLDSLTSQQFWRDVGAEVVHVADQDTTDFEKCLARITAPLIVGLGFLGARLDHSLAALRSLCVFADKPVVLVGETDVVFVAPPELRLELAAGTRVSLFAMSPVTMRPSEGLRWQLDGLQFAADGGIGTSNEALGGEVVIRPGGSGLLVMLPLETLETVARVLAQPAATRSRQST